MAVVILFCDSVDNRYFGYNTPNVLRFDSLPLYWVCSVVANSSQDLEIKLSDSVGNSYFFPNLCVVGSSPTAVRKLGRLSSVGRAMSKSLFSLFLPIAY